jgi:uncharacterized membrane protein YhaH (DUF805 family)
MDFVGSIKAGFQNYAVFRGTASRPEYWYWVLFTFLLGLVSNALDASGVLALAISGLTFLPGTAVTVRRLRDAGFSWTWLLLPIPGFIPFVMGLVNLVIELVALGIDKAIVNNPELIDAAYLEELFKNSVLVNSLVMIFFSLAYIFFTSVLVSIIFASRKSKSFEEGNKRVSPHSPETTAL